MGCGFTFGDQAIGGSGDIHPLWRLGYGQADPFVLIGASAVGHLHLQEGLPRDDAFSVRCAEGWIVMAVADGLGSHRPSRYAASFAVDWFPRILLRRLVGPVEGGKREAVGRMDPRVNIPRDAGESDLGDPLDLRRLLDPGEDAIRGELAQSGSLAWGFPPPPSPDVSIAAFVGWKEEVTRSFQEVHAGLAGQAKSLGVSLNDLACTLLVTLFHPTSGWGLAARVGDGAILSQDLGGEIYELASDDGDDPERTAAINRPDFGAHLQMEEILNGHQLAGLLVMTDGVANDFMYSDRRHWKTWSNKVLRSVSGAPSAARASASTLRDLATYVRRDSSDDRTLVILARKAPENGTGEVVGDDSQDPNDP